MKITNAETILVAISFEASGIPSSSFGGAPRRNFTRVGVSRHIGTNGRLESAAAIKTVRRKNIRLDINEPKDFRVPSFAPDVPEIRRRGFRRGGIRWRSCRRCRGDRTLNGSALSGSS